MQQVDGFRSGERDYSKLEGDTGPLVCVRVRVGMARSGPAVCSCQLENAELSKQVPRAPLIHLHGIPETAAG